MELTLLIITVLIFVGGLSLLINTDDEVPYKFQCHQCKKKFRKDELKDLRGPWHTKDWTCPHCKHQNVTLKSYDY